LCLPWETENGEYAVWHPECASFRAFCATRDHSRRRSLESEDSSPRCQIRMSREISASPHHRHLLLPDQFGNIVARHGFYQLVVGLCSGQLAQETMATGSLCGHVMPIIKLAFCGTKLVEGNAADLYLQNRLLSTWMGGLKRSQN
jgi:hypothetical protein